MRKIIKCPSCDDGTLELLSKEEKKQLNAKATQKILGCDDCKYWIDEKDYDQESW